ncbi:hypothetical protein F751_2816 [Auxenochlorella protothecoides]|uniref:Uncharacterized protein n=1 Tax=Auxenochlorella protothecoides TaxID=3075 RepID=A0A087SCV3_AUXPR|nr:hypothetical protein F751_2816 [Auxenochlorella protothecoides]KFM23557.1 hypothetical protein F751_2816 [Auxenochlorella protothecoides]
MAWPGRRGSSPSTSAGGAAPPCPPRAHPAPASARSPGSKGGRSGDRRTGRVRRRSAGGPSFSTSSALSGVRYLANTGSSEQCRTAK